ncbi:unnamed protein product [Cuscuta europaea]|uniref:BAR domain-containing protein n=1 Tax=Cuscuta europaea TaxID=41803 RepID=A0A9P1E4U1_CUSEU|nr:unnamed protein product [Cuscuta europaea]
MKTSLKTLRGLAALKHERRERKIRSLTQEDELAKATQDMVDMRDCYDRLLSAAAATVNSVYEFSESLREMGDCLLEKTSLSDDEETGKALLKLGKVQFQLQKLVDSYRSHINQTITVPSESLLSELHIVEDMKRQCDEKREIYDQLIQKHTEKGGKLRGAKGEHFSSQQLKAAYDEYDEGANVFVFRMKSLRQGQSRSLLTQAARHHAAQISLFRKALKCLEEVEPHVKWVTEQQHIDYHFSGLEDDIKDDDAVNDGDDDVDDHESNGESESHDGELSFDRVQGELEYVSTNPMELDNTDVTFPHVARSDLAKENIEIGRKSIGLRRETHVSSQSAPLLAESKLERSLQKGASPSYKIYSYVLPTPLETNKVRFSNLEAPSQPRRTSLESRDTLWHSSPLDQNKFEKARRSEKFSASGPFVSSLSASDAKKAKRQAFSGPLTGKPWPNNPRVSTSGPIGPKGYPPQFSGPLLRPLPHPSTPKLGLQASPPRLSSPKISELHELPRPPPSSSTSTRPLPHEVAHSGPLPSRVSPSVASTLPMPPLDLPRSYSIPSTSQIGTSIVPKSSKDYNLTPITLSSSVEHPPSPET